MGDTILLRRGTAANLPDLQVGEPGFATDTKVLYIGAGAGTAEDAAFCTSTDIDAIQYEPNTFTQATIEAALTAIGTTNKVTLLLRPGTWVISSNADWSAYTNVTFKIVPGAIFSGAFTLKLPNIDAGKYQVFNSNIGVVTLSGNTSVAYPEWWGIDGTADEVQINQAIAALTAGTVFLSQAAYTTSATINMKTHVNLRGASYGSQGSAGTYITYSGSGNAIKYSGIVGTLLSDLGVRTTHVDGNGIEAGNASQRNSIERVYLLGNSGASQAGTGLYLNAGTGWSGGLALKDVEIAGYKWGIKMVGANLATNTWTTVDMTNVWLVGRAAGVIAGSRGILMDPLTNGVGTYLRGGTIESFEYGVLVSDGGFGGSFKCDFEGNTENYSVGASFNGEIIVPIANNYFRQGTNASANKWFQDRHINGVLTRESKYSQKLVTYNANNDNGGQFFNYVGASIIDGGLPFFVGGFDSAGAEYDNAPEANVLRLGSHRISWGNAAPTSRTWKKGDIIWNTAPASGGATPNGWRCLATGTFSAATEAGTATSGSPIITAMADTSDFTVGNYVDASAQFAVLTALLIISKTSTTITVDRNANGSGAVTLSTTDPTFASMGVLP